jgi:hypothetical protein
MAIGLGAKQFTKVVAKAETAFGTPKTFNDSLGEILFADAIGTIDQGVTVDLGDDKTVGVRSSRLSNLATITEKAPTVNIAASNISMRNLPLFFDALATITPTNTAPSTAYEWAYVPAQTDVDTIKTYSLYATDGVQKFIADGCVPTEITLSADSSGLLQGGVTYAARNVATTTDVSTAAISAQPFVPGRFFKLYMDTDYPTKAGAGETQYSTYLTAWNFTLTPGVAPIMAMSGSVNYGGVAYTGALDATLELTIASNASATSTFPITAVGTQKFIRIQGLTTDTYPLGLTILGSFVVNSVTSIGSESDGMVLNTVSLSAAYDATTGGGAASIKVYVDSPLTARP